MRIETINEMVNALAYRQDLERIRQALLRQGAVHAAENIACALREADRDLKVFANERQKGSGTVVRVRTEADPCVTQEFEFATDQPRRFAPADQLVMCAA